MSTHTLVWILLVWGAAPPESHDAHSLGSTQGVYTSLAKCTDAGMAYVDPHNKHSFGVNYRCASLRLDPPINAPYDPNDYHDVVGKRVGVEREAR